MRRHGKYPPVFGWLQGLGKVDPAEMNRVFNMGIGIAMIVSPFYADKIVRMLASNGLESRVIGSVGKNDDGDKSVTVA